MSRDLRSAGLTSIIIPCWGQLAFTRQCLAALKSHTRRPWELIVVDNGSTDGTPDYLAGVSDMASVPVTVITNATNRGFPAAINQGLKAARGEYLVLLNNDVIVTDGWLEQLIGLVNARRGVEAEGAGALGDASADGSGRPSVGPGAGSGDPRTAASASRAGDEYGFVEAELSSSGAVRPIGLVGPMSNYATPPQLVENVPYHDLREMRAFARKWRDEHRGKWFTARKLSGFCLLMKRAVYEKIGGLDERFGLGFFDDDDLAERARRAGFDLAVARDLFVHHFGSRTFGGNGIDAAKLLDENARRFAEKWGLKEAKGKPVMLRPWRGARNGDSPARETGLRQRPGTSPTLTRSASEGHDPPPALFSPPTRSASEGLYPPPALFSPPTRSASEGLSPQPTLSSPPTRSASEDFGLSAGQATRLPDGRPGPPTGTLAGASGWLPANRSRSADFGQSAGQATRLPDGGPRPPTGTLAGASGWLPANRSRSEDFGHSAGEARRLPDGGPGPPTGTLAGASGWCDEPPVVGVNGQRAASVSLTMIVRNEEDHLAKCLGSVRGLFDEIIIVDTGSTDRTKEIARELGAKVFDFVWIDDFAAARNEALSHATGDYAFWLDADDVVEPAEREKLEALFSGLGRASAGDNASVMSAAAPHLTRPAGDLSPGRGDDHRLGEGHAPALGEGLPTTPPPGPPFARGGKGSLGAVAGAEDGLFAYVMRCTCPPGHDGARGGTVVDHVRLFPIRPGVRWTYRVHEQILPSLNRAKIPARWTDIVIRHDGYADPEVEARKLERNIKILERELIERPDDPFVLFNLGSSAVQQKDYHAALGLLERSLALSAPRDSIVRKLYALIARVHQMTGDSQEALRTCAAGLKLDPQDAELWHRKAVIHRRRGESSEAERSWRRILELTRPEQYCSFDNGIYGHITRRNLARLAAERGDSAEAGRLWNEVLAECPGDREALAKWTR